MEILAAMKATDDALKVLALAGNRERLIGYWGERVEGKEDPTLGQRAKEVSAILGAK
jgi:chitinase